MLFEQNWHISLSGYFMHQPKGYLIAIGGAEDKGSLEKTKSQNVLDFFEEGILKHIIELASKKGKPVIEVITTASSEPDEMAQTYRTAFKKLGDIDIGHIKITSREEAESKKVLDRLARCNCVMFSGGDQFRLCSTLGGTIFSDMLKQRYQDEHFIIAGTSAGAAAMSNTIICSGDPAKSFMKGEIELSLGFGFLNNVIIDTHFDKRGRFGRLVQAIATQPGTIGLGLCEDTGVVIEKGSRLKAIGSRSIVIIDGSNIRHNSIADIKNDIPISVENLTVHVMANSDLFDLNTRGFTGVQFTPHLK